MPSERNLDDIVTKFMLITCRQRPKRSRQAVQPAMFCHLIAAVDSESWDNIPLTTGSVAEFYIEPMLPHVGDCDVMYYSNIQLAIPQGHPPPTQLPAEFQNYVTVFEIIDSHLPGYVYLEIRYLLTECSDDCKYDYAEYDRGQYFGNHTFPARNRHVHGPAVFFPTPSEKALLTLDQVRCVRCLRWPPQAANWPTRHRNYGWPDSATLDRVVSNGCDVVGAVHRQCRQHEWMSKVQHRLSFSRAEIVLMNSWMPLQQIVYHMLRHFIKTEQLTDCADNSGAGTLCNYHIKTLMLWACELKPRSWWVDDIKLVRMCVQLLHILAEWLTDAWCQHYFINNCNLIDSSFNPTNIRDQLMSINETWLSTWFVDNYIQKCLQQNELCVQNLSQLLDDVSTSTKLQNAVSEFVYWRYCNSVLDLWGVFDYAEFLIAAPSILEIENGKYVQRSPLSARSYVCLMTELTKVDSRLCVYFTAVAFLKVAWKSLTRGFSDEQVDILATVCGQSVSRRYPYHSTIVLSLDVAAKLMKDVASKPLSTMSLIEIELSKAYLYRALRCNDSDSDSIYCLTNVYLAVLYYTTGQYQTAIDHCTLVTRSQDHSQCSSRVVQGKILPQIDNDIDNVLGLAVLYQHVRTAALSQKHHVQHVTDFFSELFAYYLHIKYVSDRKLSVDEFKRYALCISDTPQLFIGDVLLFLSVSRLFKFRQKPVCSNSHHTLINASKHNTLDLVELLQKSAVEHLTSYRQLEVREIGSVGKIVTTDYEALYAYKRGDHQRCLQLCTQNVHTLLYAYRMLSVRLFSEFIQLFDEDIVSLTALPLIINWEFRPLSITQMTVSLYLMTQCHLKLHSSLKSLALILDYIKGAQQRHPPDAILDHLVLKLAKRKAVIFVRSIISDPVIS